jgi:hypothetical protein
MGSLKPKEESLPTRYTTIKLKNDSSYIEYTATVITAVKHLAT